MRKWLICVLCFAFLSPLQVSADPFEPHASYTVCFTPGEDCTQEIVDAINNAVSAIWVQAYSFTSRPIGKALMIAKERGVQVQVILDKEALSGNQGTLRFFARHKIPVWIDNQPAIAHNKVIILDQTRVITGSFNFTRAAQQQNAENVLIVEDAGLAQKYLQNWQRRQQVSEPYILSSGGDGGEQSNSLLDWWHWLVNWIKKLINF